MKVAALGNKAHRLVYAADVVAATEGVDTFKGLLRQRFRWKYGSLQNLIRYKSLLGNLDKKYSRMLTLYRMPMAFFGEVMLLLEPLLLGYMLYVSYSLQSVGFIVGSYMLITTYLLLNVMPDEHTSFRQRIKLFLYSPFAYFIFYIMNVIQVSASVRCLFNGKALVKQTPHSGTWRTPDRRGTASMMFNKA
jgi:cellulose synthase/poly-beta-1,6-N-acetylglucosamine synthase-like glycosyltransferase